MLRELYPMFISILITDGKHGLQFDWLKLMSEVVREKTCCHNMGYSFQLTDRIIHTKAFGTPVMEREIAQ